MNDELEAILAKCERKAWEIAGLDGVEIDPPYNQGWRDGAECVALAIAKIIRAQAAKDKEA
jgi:hypothetical protein